MSKPTLLSGLIVLIALLSALGLDRYGRDVRVYGNATGSVDSPDVEKFFSDTPSGVIGFWRSRGYHGRKLVYVGREWDRVNPSDLDPELPLYRPYPLHFFNLLQEREARLNDMNYLYVAAVTGLAREVTAALAEPGYTDIRERLADSKNLSSAGGGFHQTANGFPRYFTTPGRLVAPDEAVLLMVSASYFSDRTGGELLNDLVNCGLTVDSVALSLARHDPLVTTRERDELIAFGRTIGVAPDASEPEFIGESYE